MFCGRGGGGGNGMTKIRLENSSTLCDLLWCHCRFHYRRLSFSVGIEKRQIHSLSWSLAWCTHKAVEEQWRNEWKKIVLSAFLNLVLPPSLNFCMATREKTQGILSLTRGSILLPWFSTHWFLFGLGSGRFGRFFCSNAAAPFLRLTKKQSSRKQIRFISAIDSRALAAVSHNWYIQRV